MTTESKNGYVKWTVFTFIMGVLMGVAVWFANMTNTKLDNLVEKLDNIDRRTSFLEGLNEGQKSSFKVNVGNLLDRMYQENE